jgi:hypothetical protein
VLLTAPGVVIASLHLMNKRKVTFLGLCVGVCSVVVFISSYLIKKEIKVTLGCMNV